MHLYTTDGLRRDSPKPARLLPVIYAQKKPLSVAAAGTSPKRVAWGIAGASVSAVSMTTLKTRDTSASGAKAQGRARTDTAKPRENKVSRLEQDRAFLAKYACGHKLTSTEKLRLKKMQPDFGLAIITIQAPTYGCHSLGAVPAKAGTAHEYADRATLR
jgi:hypothetical protein